jgi:hypothetical protein
MTLEEAIKWCAENNEDLIEAVLQAKVASSFTTFLFANGE